MKKILFLGSVLSLLLSANVKSAETTYKCFISNEHLVSPSVYEFDVFIQSTSTDFLFRTFQGCFTFDPSFIPANATAHAGYVPGTSQLSNYNPGRVDWSTAGHGFEIAA